MNILILGGTGSLGQALIKKLYGDHKIRVVSRDEHKQANLKKQYPRLDLRLGDIRDVSSIAPHFNDIELVYHVAALKHVDLMESNVSECVKTNYLGTVNAVECAAFNGVRSFVFSSTDKAIDPINTYGYSKALAEKYLFSKNEHSKMACSVYRWGNVLGSAGSVIPQFIKTLRHSNTVHVTDMAMTRFWLRLDDAVDYMIGTWHEAHSKKTMLLPDMRASKVVHVVDILAQIMGIQDYRVKVMGLRPGEKLHESLVSVHDEGHVNSRDCVQYSDQELISLLKPLVEQYDLKRAV
jgi:FlaA1/EpsC-like NDP-sugar epimerase